MHIYVCMCILGPAMNNLAIKANGGFITDDIHRWECVNVFMYVHTYVCMQCMCSMYVCMYECIEFEWICIYVCIEMCVDVCAVYILNYMYVCMYVCMYVGCAWTTWRRPWRWVPHTKFWSQTLTSCSSKWSSPPCASQRRTSCMYCMILYIHVYMYICMYICMCICVVECYGLPFCMLTYIHTYIHTKHILIHTYIYTYIYV